MTHDLIIIGGGPAGVAAGVYAARKKLTTVFITKEFGGQSNVSPNIENWIGTISIPGAEFAQALEKHLRAHEGDCLSIVTDACVTKLEKTDATFTATTDTGDSFTARAVLIASGSHRRKLTIPGAKEFDQKGLTYCASCDGPVFTGLPVAVVGGGNAGFETAAQLLAYTKQVTLLEQGEFSADPVTIDRVMRNKNMTALSGAEPLEVVGEQMVTGLKYKDRNGSEQLLSVQGIFVEIGLVPNTDFVQKLLDLDKHKHIVVDHTTQRASIPGIWAAGDAGNGLYNQNNIAAGDAVKAVEDIYIHLRTR